MLTVGPNRLLVRCVLEEEPPGRLEDKVSLYGSESLEFRRHRVQKTRAERRTLGDIGRVQVEELIEIAAGDARDVVAGEVAASLCLSSTTAGNLSAVNILKGGVRTYVTLIVARENSVPSSSQSCG